LQQLEFGIFGRTAVRTAVLLKIPHSNCYKTVPNRPLRGRRGRFGTLLQLLECGIFGRTAVVVGFIERARQAGGRRRPAGGHRPSAGGQLGGGGTGCPQPPGQPDARQRVGGQGARRYKRGAGRRRAGLTTTGTFAFLPAAPIPSIPGRAALLLPCSLFFDLLHAVSARPGAPSLSLVGVYLPSLSPGISAPFGWSELPTREISSSVYSTRPWHQLMPGLCSIDAKPESLIPALPHMRITDLVPTNTSRCASQRNHEDLKHWLKLCGEATP